MPETGFMREVAYLGVKGSVAAVGPTGFEVEGDLATVVTGDRYRVSPTWSLNKQPSATYYYDLSAGLWRSTTAPTADAGDAQLSPGSFLTIRSASGGSATWAIPSTP
jgi:hypothetical protein